MPDANQTQKASLTNDVEIALLRLEAAVGPSDEWGDEDATVCVKDVRALVVKVKRLRQALGNLIEAAEDMGDHFTSSMADIAIYAAREELLHGGPRPADEREQAD